MFKKVAKFIRSQLLKINWFKRSVEVYKLNQEKQRNDKRFAQLMHSGNMIHLDDPDDDLLVDYMDGRMIGQKQVTPNFIRPFGMGRWKF